jgi:hypothetical protein
MMDGLDLLERFRGGVPEPDDLTIARARGSWRQKGTGGARSPKRRRRVALVAVAAAVIVLAVIAPSLLPDGPNPAAAAIFHRFALIARDAPAEAAPGPGQYLYRKTIETGTAMFVSRDGAYRYVFRSPSETERWLANDGSSHVVTTAEPYAYLTQADQATFEACVAAHGQAACEIGGAGRTSTQNYDPGELFVRDTSQLPAEPDQLLQLIEDRVIVGGPKGDWESFVLATDLIRDSYARPELRAALYEVMANLSGIEVVGNTTDQIGRHGIALASTHNGVRNEVVFDPKTAEILEERSVVVDDSSEEGVFQNPGPGAVGYAPAGQSLDISTYVTFGDVVDQLGHTG